MLKKHKVSIFFIFLISIFFIIKYYNRSVINKSLYITNDSHFLKEDNSYKNKENDEIAKLRQEYLSRRRKFADFAEACRKGDHGISFKKQLFKELPEVDTRNLTKSEIQNLIFEEMKNYDNHLLPYPGGMIVHPLPEIIERRGFLYKEIKRLEKEIEKYKAELEDSY